jgi:hypothetical protein
LRNLTRSAANLAGRIAGSAAAMASAFDWGRLLIQGGMFFHGTTRIYKKVHQCLSYKAISQP